MGKGDKEIKCREEDEGRGGGGKMQFTTSLIRVPYHFSLPHDFQSSEAQYCTSYLKCDTLLPASSGKHGN